MKVGAVRETATTNAASAQNGFHPGWQIQNRAETEKNHCCRHEFEDVGERLEYSTPGRAEMPVRPEGDRPSGQ